MQKQPPFPERPCAKHKATAECLTDVIAFRLKTTPVKQELLPHFLDNSVSKAMVLASGKLARPGLLREDGGVYMDQFHSLIETLFLTE